MNKKSLLAVYLLIIFPFTFKLSGQEEYPSGKPIATIFTDYKQQLNGSDNFHGFNVSRAYFGYKYQADSRLSAQILLDVGSPLTTQTVSSKRYTYLKNAYISYRLNDISITAGISSTPGSGVPMKFWSKRYIAKPFLVEYDYINVADIGVVMDYRVSDLLTIDAAILNGEGYTKIQMDETLQFTGGVTLTPLAGLNIRLYGDIYKKVLISQNTLSVFAGYRSEKITASLQLNRKTDADMTDQHNIYGYSCNLAYRITPKIELFGRYDVSGSVIPEGETDPWNELNDGSLVIGGIQYTYSKNFRIALDYQGWSTYNKLTEGADFIQIDCEFRF